MARKFSTDPAQSIGLRSKKKSGPMEGCFFLTSPFIELIGTLFLTGELTHQVRRSMAVIDQSPDYVTVLQSGTPAQKLNG
jgi:hypothetical protein